MLLFLYTSELEDFNLFFPFQWICAINNISRQIYLTDNPEVGACFHLSVHSFNLPSHYSSHGNVKYMSKRAVLSCFHRQLQSN